MRVIYNGIDLGVQETHEFSAECVLDDAGVDYLFTRYTIVVRAVVNGAAEVFREQTATRWATPGQGGTPGTGSAGTVPAERPYQFRNGPVMSYRFGSQNSFDGPVGGPVPGPVPPGTAGTTLPTYRVGGSGPRAVGLDPRQSPMNPTDSVAAELGVVPGRSGLSAGVNNRLRVVVAEPTPAALTYQAVRHRLTTPRGRLFVFAGGWAPGAVSDLILQSPLPDDRVDCNNGPKPRILSIVQAFGDATTFLVDFAVETYINEAELNGAADVTALLSNRFSQRHDIVDGWTAVTTTGTAIYRTDYVYRLPQSPDAKRPVLFMPIPAGFRREPISVRGRDDVCGVDYEYTDRQVPVNFVAGPYARAASISAVHRQAIVTDGDVLQGALTAYERVLGMRANRHIANAARGDVTRVGDRTPDRVAPPARTADTGGSIFEQGRNR